MQLHQTTSKRLRSRAVPVLAAAGACLTLVGPLAAQGRGAADPAERAAAMERLSFLVGEWSGDAWAVVGRGERHELRQTESIRYTVAGQVLLVEGVGRQLTDGMVGDTAFHAVGTIDWMPDRGYLLRSYTHTGQYGEFPLTVTDDGYSWSMDVPSGRVRYRMRLTPDGEFKEKGWFVTAEGREVPTFEMVLHRTARR